MAGLLGTAVVLSLLPAGVAIASRGLINGLVSALGGRGGGFALLLPWLALGFAMTLVQALGNVVNSLITQRLNEELSLRVHLDILRHAGGLDVGTFEDSAFADVMERAVQNAPTHVTTLLTQAVSGVTRTLQCLSLGVILVAVEPLVGGAALLIGLPHLWFQWRLGQQRHERERRRTTRRRWTRYFISRLTSANWVAEIKLFDLAPLLIERFRALALEFRVEQHHFQRRAALGASLFGLLSTVAVYAILGRVCARAIGGGLSVGDVAMFGAAALRFRAALDESVQALTRAMEHALFVAFLWEFLAVRPRIAEGGTIAPESTRGELDLKGVSFTYSRARRPAISEISLHIAPGETVAFVGEHGAGKTTLAKLIARLYDPDQGCILLDGTDLRELSTEYVRRQVACVLQDFGRYEGTVAENIAYGDWRRLLGDREGIRRAARLAGVDALIEGLPDGYDTRLGRSFGNHDLSGGQWRRIAVARVFARDPAVFVLDEPTASLDARAEYELFVRFRELAKGRTTILISHRFSTVSIADRIVVLHRGRIVEQGTHGELLAADSHYAALYDLHQRQMPAPRQK